MMDTLVVTGANVSLMKKIRQLKQDLSATDHKPINTIIKREKTPDQPCRSLEEEDNIFLNAMGASSKPTTNHTSCTTTTNAVVLKGKEEKNILAANKTIFSKSTPYLKALPKVYATANKSEESVTTIIGDTDTLAVSIKETDTHMFQSVKNTSPITDVCDPSTLAQTQIYLAAGIRVDVSSHLDLSSHTKSDANERLKECVINGYILGWHNIHVITGCSEETGQAVTDLLKSSTGKYITRYAQAPMPMGGSNAWILYF